MLLGKLKEFRFKFNRYFFKYLEIFGQIFGFLRVFCFSIKFYIDNGIVIYFLQNLQEMCINRQFRYLLFYIILENLGYIYEYYSFFFLQVIINFLCLLYEILI